MNYSQLFLTEEEQQNAVRKAHNELGALNAQNALLGAGFGATPSSLGMLGAAGGAGAFGSLSQQANQLMQLQQAQAALQQQLNQQLAATAGATATGPTGSGPSMLDITRAENILAAMTANAPSAAQQQQQQLMAMNSMRFNGLLPSTSGLGLEKNPAFSTLATANHAGGLPFSQIFPLGGGADGGLGMGGVFNNNINAKRPRSDSSPNESPAHKRPSSDSTGNLKLAAELVALEEQSRPRSTSQLQQPKRRKAKTFPIKLMTALMENPNEEAVAWLPDGKSFVVVQPDLFCSFVLSKVFKECKYASFVRKLHRWGFVRLTSGTGTDCFHHPMFIRSNLNLASQIVCTPRDTPERKKPKNLISDKPPSLAGVEKFFRAKAQHLEQTASKNAAAAANKSTTSPPITN